MKKIVVTLVLTVLAMAVSVKAEEKDLSVSASASVLSAYVGSSGVRYTDGAVAQADATVSHSSGVSVTLWASKGFSGKDESSDEIDLIFGFEKEIGQALVSLGLGYYDFVRAKEGNVCSLTAEMSQELKVKDSPCSLTSSTKVEMIQPVDKDAPYDFSYLVEIGAGIKVAFDGFDLNLNPALVYDEGAYGGVSHFIWRWELGAEFEVRGVTISPSITWFNPIHAGVSKENMLDREIVAGVKATYEF
jgi:hypothetical protein